MSKGKRRKRRKKRRGGKNWIQRAIKRPGSLRAWLKRHEKKLRRLTGFKVFNKDGTVNERLIEYLERHPDVIKKISKSHWKRIWRKVHLADTLLDLRDKR
ncbi:MAG: hypothetical protein ACTSXX_06135 [Candidatus Baldrarchaeia archaeon]